MEKNRIALYGGAFDPVHRAHIAVARAAREQVSLDRVIFLPAAQSPLKAHGPIVSDSDRLKMLEIALEGMEGYEVDDSELQRGGVSYTIETVSRFCQKCSERELFWILGGDQFAQLDRWRAVKELVRMLRFLVLARPGYGISPPEIPNLRWQKLDAPLMDMSSTQVR
ncbi:MAG: nicotinate (nicotinamide) nucleotide adenylyltransferase, partial [Opitutales bacterium]